MKATQVLQQEIQPVPCVFWLQQPGVLLQQQTTEPCRWTLSRRPRLLLLSQPNWSTRQRMQWTILEILTTSPDWHRYCYVFQFYGSYALPKQTVSAFPPFEWNTYVRLWYLAEFVVLTSLHNLKLRLIWVFAHQEELNWTVVVLKSPSWHYL